jgi:adenylate kinase family enzyme
MRRVLVLGCSGAGKTTFARKLASVTRLPLVSLDACFWLPGWIETPRQEWRGRVERLAAEDAWIMDGSYVGTLDIRLPRADTLLWLDLPRHVCMRRVLWRIATSYGRVRSEMAPGCAERFDLQFLHYIWTFTDKYRPLIASALARHGPHLSPVIIRRDADAARFLDKVAREKPRKAD